MHTPYIIELGQALLMGLRLWNSLATNLRQMTSLTNGQFWRFCNHILEFLKVTAHCDYDFVRYSSTFTYLLTMEMCNCR